MICQLCLQEKKLLKNSHIIPNFLYKGIFDAKHKFVSVNLDDYGDKKFHQTGFKDSDILCAECDNGIIGAYERYASNTIFGDHKNGTVAAYSGSGNELPYIRFENLDYDLTKLFYLSILWKSHLSKNPFFKSISLGGKHAEKIRGMLLEGDGGPEDLFEVVLVVPVADSRMTKSMLSPLRLKQAGNTVYVFHINEIMYHFNISQHNKNSMFNAAIIKRDGILDIGVIHGEFSEDYFDSFTQKKLQLKPNK